VRTQQFGHFLGRGVAVHWQQRPVVLDGNIDQAHRTSVRLEVPGEPSRELMSNEPVQERRLKVLEHFIDSINRGQEPEPGVLDNQKTLAVVFGSIKSVLTKAEIRIFEATKPRRPADTLFPTSP
jgi:predicted dehydrogenase